MARASPAIEARDSLNEYIAGWQATFGLLRDGFSWSGSERNCVFLNTGESRFANVASVSGLDFADDGRALAVVDWDHDGDLDVWLRNRSGPRLRLMLNQSSPDQRAQSVALRLVGTTTNGDAIGARAHIELASPNSRPLVRSVDAGAGFLSQSSKWLHFGLADSNGIRGVVVDWPGGQSERFEGVEPGGRFVLREGTGEARSAPPRSRSTLIPSPQPPPPDFAAKRTLLPRRLPLPLLYDVDSQAKPRLLNFWASWCLPCLEELRELTAHESEVRAADLEIIALSVDGLGTDPSTSPADAESMIAAIGFPFTSSFSSTESLAKIELLQEMLFERRRPFAVPTSLLIDRYGDLAAIYRGRIEVDQLLEDVANLDLSSARIQAISVPLKGRWYQPLPEIDLAQIARDFRPAFPHDAVRYFRLSLEQQYSELEVHSRPADDLAHGELATTHLGLAQTLDALGLVEEAIGHFSKAVEWNPIRVEARIQLAAALSSQGDFDAAIAQLKATLEIEPDNAEARRKLGRALASSGGPRNHH